MKLRKGIKRFFLLSVATVVLASIWFMWTVGRYGPAVEEAIESFSGLPASLEAVDLVLVPSPHLVIRNLSIGDEDFRVDVGEIVAQLNLWGLARRNLHVTSVKLVDVTATVPANLKEFTDKAGQLAEHIRTREVEESAWDVQVDLLEAHDGVIRLRDASTDYMRLSIDALDLFAEEMSAELSTDFLQWGDGASLGGRVTVTRDVDAGAITGIVGSATLARIELAQAVPLEGVPESTLEAEISIEGTSFEQLRFEVGGDVESEVNRALSGEFSTSLWWDAGTLTANDVRWNAEGVHLSADLTRHSDGEIAYKAREVDVTSDALEDLLSMATFETFRILSREGASLHGSNLLGGLSADGEPRFVSGEIKFEGLEIALNDGESVAKEVHGHVEIEEGIVHVRELAAEDTTLTGTVRPDLENHTFAMDLRGETRLSRAMGTMFAGTDTITDLGGDVTFTRIAGTFVDGEGLPDDLVIEGSLRNGRITVESDDFQATLRSISMSFETDSEGIATTASMESEKVGPLRVNGEYRFSDKRWVGTLNADLARLARPFLDEDEMKYARPILEQFGNSEFRVAAQLPKPGDDRIEITLTRTGEPSLDSTIQFVGENEGYSLGAITAKTRVRVDGLNEFLPGRMTASGQSDITFSRDAGSEQFEAYADLSMCSVRVGSQLEKRAGDSLSVRVNGEASDSLWAAELFTVDCLGVRVPLVLVDGRLRGTGLNIDLARLVPLLPEGAYAKGRVEGGFATNPMEGNLRLNSVALTIEQDVALDSVQGDVQFRDGFVEFRNVLIRGANSDCRLSATLDNGTLNGSLTGSKFDINSVLTLIEEARPFFEDREDDLSAALSGEPVRVAVATTADERIKGSFDVRLDSLFYGRGHVEDVRATISSEQGAYHVTNLRLRPYTGSVSGTVDILPLSAGKRELRLVLDMKDIDTRILDEIFFEDPREFVGSLTGTLRFRAPLANKEEMMKSADGEMTWVARNGTFGKLGLSTKFLTVLRTTEIIDRRIPSLRDKGLTYEVCSGSIDLENGVMRFNDTVLRSPSYVMELNGGADFAKDVTKAHVFVNILEAINRVAGNVPIIREISEITAGNVGIAISASGSPFDPRFRINPARTILQAPVRIGEDVVKTVTDGVKKLFGIKD